MKRSPLKMSLVTGILLWAAPAWSQAAGDQPDLSQALDQALEASRESAAQAKQAEERTRAACEWLFAQQRPLYAQELATHLEKIAPHLAEVDLIAREFHRSLPPAERSRVRTMVGELAKLSYYDQDYETYSKLTWFWENRINELVMPHYDAVAAKWRRGICLAGSKFIAQPGSGLNALNTSPGACRSKHASEAVVEYETVAWGYSKTFGPKPTLVAIACYGGHESDTRWVDTRHERWAAIKKEYLIEPACAIVDLLDDAVAPREASRDEDPYQLLSHIILLSSVRFFPSEKGYLETAAWRADLHCGKFLKP